MRSRWRGRARCSSSRTATSRCALSSAAEALERTARTGRGRLVAALVRRFGAGELDLIEGVVQDAMVRALETWSVDGIPERSEGWLLRVAGNLAIDARRREARTVGGVEPVGEAQVAPSPSIDDQLGLMFLCCHPALPRAAQIALTLKIEGGFTTRQIALAFVTDEKTLAQRIVRAKQQL